MKKFVIGIAVLSLLLISGLFVAKSTEEMYKPVVALLEEAADTALTGSFAEAKARAEEAKKLWDKYKKATTCGRSCANKLRTLQ